MYAIGRHSRSNAAVLRLALVAGAIVGRTGKILTFSNRRAAEVAAKEHGEWYFVVSMTKASTIRRALTRVKAKTATKRTARKGTKRSR